VDEVFDRLLVNPIVRLIVLLVVKVLFWRRFGSYGTWKEALHYVLY